MWRGMEKVGYMLMSELELECDLKILESKYLKSLGLSCIFVILYIQYIQVLSGSNRWCLLLTFMCQNVNQVWYTMLLVDLLSTFVFLEIALFCFVLFILLLFFETLLCSLVLRDILASPFSICSSLAFNLD